MAWLTILVITLTLAVPLALLAWLLFGRLYARGQLERGLDKKSFKASLKRIRSESKTNRGDFLHNRWMKFGGGFYGLAAFWTFACIEVTEVTGFILNFPGFAALFADGIPAFFISLAVNQVLNLASALAWVTWWPGQVFGASPALWLALAYGGYLCGLQLAQREVTLQSLRERLRPS
ncbi:hypothetical protein Q6D67_20320 [Haliea sp. E1-2-M8]|uniref:hypothetical protein n=1 Tax=Haliea sp. E1-2-M8 TaxID=3064706 RepID=UPI0027218434|nr:hypothetical protein [Haliea sp. E1-2-M8]MDO8864036.1 hypothetical protein [Haliea sp. E1-2-M8]